MDIALAELVWERARGGCEYCQVPQLYDEVPFEIDHVIAKQHGGKTARQQISHLSLALPTTTTKARTWAVSIRRRANARGFSIPAATSGSVTFAGMGQSWSAAPP